MNADELCQEVIDIVDDPGYEDPAEILKRVNRSQRRIADLLFLPDLKDGFASVNTTVGQMEVHLPDTYHKGLYMARSGGVALDIFMDVGSMSMVRGGVSLDVGTLAAVALKKASLIYQKVPAAQTAIELYFYRLPVDMAEGESFFPDGAQGNEDFEWAIIHDTCEKIFSRIEDGMEGAKVNTSYHRDMFAEKISIVEDFCKQQGIAYPIRPSTNLNWLGI